MYNRSHHREAWFCQFRGLQQAPGDVGDGGRVADFAGAPANQSLQVVRADEVLVKVVRDVSLDHLRPAAPLFRLESLR